MMPWRGALDLAGQLEQRILTPQIGDELHADGQVISAYGQGQRDGRRAGDIT
jgi:hypothetical protein